MVVISVLMMVVGILLWILEKWYPPTAKPEVTITVTGPAEDGSQRTASVAGPIAGIIGAAKDLAFPTLVFIIGAIFLMLDQGWITVETGGP